MKTVELTQSYINDKGIATFEFDVEMKTRHDPKGKFSIGFLVIDKNDGQGVKLGVFDDDRKIIGTFDDNEKAIKILDRMIETRSVGHIFHYNYPDTKAWKKGPSVKKEMILNLTQNYIDGFILSKRVLLSGVIPDDLRSSWRNEN